MSESVPPVENPPPEKPVENPAPEKPVYSEKYYRILSRMERCENPDFSKITEYPSGVSADVVSAKVMDSIKNYFEQKDQPKK